MSTSIYGRHRCHVNFFGGESTVSDIGFMPYGIYSFPFLFPRTNVLLLVVPMMRGHLDYYE